MKNIKSVYCFILVVSLSFFMMACSNVQTNPTDDLQVSPLVTPSETSNEESSFFGSWLLYEVAFRDIDRVTMKSRFDNGRDEDKIGQILEINANSFKFNNIVYDDISINASKESLYYLNIFANVSTVDLSNFIEKYNVDNDNISRVEITYGNYTHELFFVYIFV